MKKYIGLLLVTLFILAGCSFQVQDTPEAREYWQAYAEAHPTAVVETPALPTVTPQVVPCIDVKANIDAKGRKLYHLPTMRNYKQVVIDESKGEKIFCQEQDAIDAGWTKAGN